MQVTQEAGRYGAAALSVAADTDKLSVFHAALEQALKADARRFKQNLPTSKVLLAQMKAEGYSGSYSRDADFIREWRGRRREGGAFHVLIPLSLELGEPSGSTGQGRIGHRRHLPARTGIAHEAVRKPCSGV